MKTLLYASFILYTCASAIAHPGVGIVQDSRGNVFYTDLSQVWKIDPDGKKSVAVPNVHTHELCIDSDDTLYGEHLWYEGDATKKWRHRVWRLTRDGNLSDVIKARQGFRNDYSFVRDAAGNMYWADFNDNMVIKRRSPDGNIVAHATADFKDVRWMTATADGTLYLIDSGSLRRINPEGKVETIIARLSSKNPAPEKVAERHYLQGLWTDRQGNVYVAVSEEQAVVKVGLDRTISVVARSQAFWHPSGGMFDRDGNLWLLEYDLKNSVRVRRIDKSGRQDAPATAAASANDAQEVLLFTSFRHNGEDGLHLACSSDGLKWSALNDDKSFLKPEVGSEKLMRDPCIVHGPDGEFHVVWTTGWRGKDIGYAHSKDLVHWSAQKAIPVMGHEKVAMNCWAPEIVFDAKKKQYLIFWATTIPGRFPQTEDSGDKNLNHRIYSTTTKDFENFTPTRLFFDPGYSVIDATILEDGGKFCLFFKDETARPTPKKHLRVAQSDNIDGPFRSISEPFTPDWVEGPSAIRIDDAIVVYFDMYRAHQYGAMRSTDLKSWQDITEQLLFPEGMRHGTVIRVPRAVLEPLLHS